MKFDIHPAIARNAADVLRWREWNRATQTCGGLVTDVFTRGDYPGTDSGWESLQIADEKLRALRARRLPPLRRVEEPARSSVPPLYRGEPPAWLSESKPFDTATEWAAEWLGSRGRIGLLISGPVGVGKTGLATWVARLCGEPNDATYWPVRDLLARVKADFDTNRNTLSHAKNKPLIVLDDIGTERPTDFNRDVLAELIETRFNAGLATVVTTNLHQRDGAGSLQQHLGPRAYSRIVEATVELVVTGTDRRLAA